MTAQNERTYEKVEIIPEKPILLRLDVLKPAKPVVNPHTKKETTMVNWLLRVDDRKYPQFDGMTVFHRTNAWCCAGTNGGRNTASYTFLESLIGAEHAQNWDRVDLQALLETNPDEVFTLYGKYVVGWMNPADRDENGKITWQNPKEFKSIDEMEWDVESRRMDQETMRRFIGKPQAKLPPKAADPKPESEASQPAPPVKETAPPAPAQILAPVSTKPFTMAEVDEQIKAHRTERMDLIRSYVLFKGVDKISALSEPDRRHLWHLMQIEAYQTDKRAASLTVKHLDLRGKASFEDLDPSDATLLLETIRAALADPVPF